MEKINRELLDKANKAKNVEELVALAKQNGVDMTEEQAKAYYAQLHPTFGEIDDDELDNVAGGGCGGNEGDGINDGDRVYCPTACPKCGNHYGYYHSQVYGLCGSYIITCDKCDADIWDDTYLPSGIKKA